MTTNLHNLAELIERDDGRLGEAEALLREALELDRRISESGTATWRRISVRSA